jgi:hypothetical protein
MRALIDEGAGPGKSLHSWRCEYPDRYGPCDCVEGAAREVAAAVVAALDLPGRDRETAAKALDEAADSVECDCGESADECFCTSAHWLRSRAADLRKEAGQ